MIFANCRLSVFLMWCSQTSGFLPHTMSQVTYDIVGRSLRHRRSHLRYRMSHRTYDIVCTIFKGKTYDIVGTTSQVMIASYFDLRYRITYIRYRRSQGKHIVYDFVGSEIYTMSQVVYIRHRRCISYTIQQAHFWHTISYVWYTISQGDIRCRVKH